MSTAQTTGQTKARTSEQSKAEQSRATTTARAAAKSRIESAGATDGAANEVRLVGRVSGVPTTVELPSGDSLVTFRVSVERPPATRRTGSSASAQRVDSIPCTAWSAVLRRRVASWRPGDVVEVVGAVRCRFYQAGGATRSRVEVEATSARIIRRAPGA